jgi:hypothetical protein
MFIIIIKINWIIIIIIIIIIFFTRAYIAIFLRFVNLARK